MHDRPSPPTFRSARFPAEPASARRARALVQDLLERADEGAAELAALLTSELATNAVRHARSAFVVRATVHGQRLRVEVTDTDPSHPTVRQASSRDTSGRGIMLVDSLADDWGVADDPEGKVVWFELGVCGDGRCA